jgi:hypothetical protein
MHRLSFVFAAISLACLSVAGSGGCSRTAGSTVSGTLVIDGKPAPAGIRIDFEPQVEKASSSTGYTDAQGRYTMMFNRDIAGVMPGESVVRLLILPDFAPDGVKPLADELQRIRLPDSVSRNTTLRKTVKPGHNEIDITVETAP